MARQFTHPTLNNLHTQETASLGSWEYNPNLLTIAHQESVNCQLCTLYKLHLEQAYRNASTSPSFQSAIAAFVSHLHPPPATHPDQGSQPEEPTFSLPPTILPDIEHCETPSSAVVPTPLPSPPPPIAIPLVDPLPGRTYSSVCAQGKVCHPAREPAPTAQVGGTTSPPPKRGKNPSRLGNSLPHTMQGLLNLIKTAQKPDNVTERELIKAHCRIAHQTPAANRTAMQKELLYLWRNPETAPTLAGFNSSQPGQHQPPHNPRYNSSLEEWYNWYCAYPNSLPRCVRRDPTTGLPLKLDIEAWNVCRILRPKDVEKGKKSPENVVNRRVFEATLFALLSSPARYAGMIHEQSGIPEVTAKLEEGLPAPYNGPFPITELSVAKHLAATGLTPANVNSTLRDYAARCLEQVQASQSNAPLPA